MRQIVDRFLLIGLLMVQASTGRAVGRRCGEAPGLLLVTAGR